MKRIAPIFMSMVEDLESVYERFDETELQTILEYLSLSCRFFQKKARELINLSETNQ